MAQVKERGGGGEETPLPSFIFWLSFHFSRGQNRKSPSSVLFCAETKRKRLLRRLAVKWPIGSANTFLSHGPGNEETSRKWGSPSGSRKSGSSQIVVGAIFDATTVFLSKMNLRRRWTVFSLAWEAVLKMLNHGKRMIAKSQSLKRYKTSHCKYNSTIRAEATFLALWAVSCQTFGTPANAAKM